MTVSSHGRIIISLRPLPQAEASIATAIRLAAALQLEAVGMFIQDESLMNFAGLPFSGGLDAYGKPIESVTPGSMLRDFDRMAKRWQQLLSDEAAKARVNCSFTRERGKFLNVVQTALLKGDYLVISTSGSEYEASQLHDQLAALPAGINGVIVVPRTVVDKQHAPVIALLDGDNATQRIVKLAARLAQLTNVSLEILAHTENAVEIEHQLSEIEPQIPSEVSVNYRPFAADSIEHTVKTLHQISPGFVVAASDNELLQKVQSVALLCRAAKAPIVLLRNED